MTITRTRWARLLAVLVALALLAASCGDSDDDTEGDGEPAATSEAGDTETTDPPADTEGDTDEGETPDPTEGEAAPAADATGYEFVDAAEAGEYAGTEVSILGVWTEAEAEKFEASLAGFAERTGIDISYEGTTEFETLVNVRVESGDPPDIAMFPQPGLVASLVESGDVVDLGSFIDAERLAEDYSPTWIELGTVDGQLSGIFYRASTKSIVWYPVEAWDAAGYEVPETWDELLALSDQMVADGSQPWCISIENGDATGWVATDWLEEILLRSAPVEIYDQWITNEIPFDHPEVLEAAAIMEDVWFDEDYVFGGRTGILTTFIGDTPTPMFDADGPSCWMHRQAGWIIDFFPEDRREFGVDADYFYLPPIEEEFGRPVLGGGDQAAMFEDRPEVRAVMQYLATPDAARGWAEAGGFIAANGNVPLDWYATDGDRRQAEILVNATTFRFDASDLMPADVGVGTFWSGMVDWIGGDDAASVFAAIDASWPAS